MPLADDTVEFFRTENFAEKFFSSDPAAVSIRCGGASHPGRVRTRNEDHYAVVRRTRTQDVLLTNMPVDELAGLDESAYMLVVADGIGGAAFGELASRLAIRTVWELAGCATSWIMQLTDVNAQQVRERIDAYAERIQQEIERQVALDAALTGMGTTWTSAYLVGRHALIAHLGDSRAYLLRHGALWQVTHDHTLAQSLIESGMAPDDVKCFAHILTNCFGGSGGEASPELKHLELHDGDGLLLCTDGLTDLVSEGLIADAIRKNPAEQQCCDALVELALAHGGHDNVTVILARCLFADSKPSVPPP